MSLKPIKACGRIRDESKVETGERDSLAYRMAVEGVTSTPEYIAMIDRQVASGELRDNLADAIRLAVADRIITNQKYTFPQFAAAIAYAVAELMSDQGYRSSFDFSIIDYTNSVRSRFAGQPRPELTDDEQRQFNTVMAQLAADNSGDIALMREIDRALLIIREKILVRMGVDLKSVNASPLAAMGVSPMEVEIGNEDDDPLSAVHMDLSVLTKQFEGVLAEPQNLVPNEPCHCGGACQGKNPPVQKQD